MTHSDPASGNAYEFTVSELSSALKRMVEDGFAHVRVKGEISGLKRAASGHVYLALKDEQAVLDAVMWKGVAASLRFAPEDGLEVVATGKLSTYPGRSKYQMIIERLEVAGVGALMALLDARKKALAAEGLFDAARKRPLPYLPEVIGVVTSPTGSVIRDILHRLADRFPRRVLVWPVLVQGEKAAAEIAAAIEGFNRMPQGGAVPRPDLLIVARGGGSLEDLWPFNEEIVVRAAAASVIPLISAVGHETDTTLIDFAADRRAPTPSAAAEIAVPVRADLVYHLDDLGARLKRAAARNLAERQERLIGLQRALPSLRDLVALPSQRLDDLGERLPRALCAGLAAKRALFERMIPRLSPGLLSGRMRIAARDLAEQQRRLADGRVRLLERKATGLATAGRLLETLGYHGVLARGYAVVRDAAGAVVARSVGLRPAAALEIEFADGRVDAVVGGGRPKPASKPAPQQGKLL